LRGEYGDVIASIYGISTQNLYRFAACMAEEITPKDKGSTHNNIRCITDDRRNKVDAHLCISE